MSLRGFLLPERLMTDWAHGSAPTPVPDLATVDVWCANLDVGPERLKELSRCLNREEQARAARFHFDRDRSRFTAARGYLRNLLASYLGKAPDLVRFGYGPQGKPVLLEDPDLHFNVSHAADVLVVGVARDRPLGIDIERVPPDDVVDTVSVLVFSAPERQALRCLAGAGRRESFAQFWTRKEAYIKADGRGMSVRLDHIDVSTVPGRVLLLDEACDQWSACPSWTLRSLSVGTGFACALAAQGDWLFACYDLALDW